MRASIAKNPREPATLNDGMIVKNFRAERMHMRYHLPQVAKDMREYRIRVAEAMRIRATLMKLRAQKAGKVKP